MIGQGWISGKVAEITAGKTAETAAYLAGCEKQDRKIIGAVVGKKVGALTSTAVSIATLDAISATATIGEIVTERILGE